MPSPLNLRARLRSLFGKGSVPQVITSDEDALKEFSDELTKAMHLLAGGREECKKIYKWMKDNPEIDEVFAHTTKRSELSFLIQETSFARVIRRYEKELGLEPRVLGNQEIQNVLDGGRHIRAIRKEAGSDEIHFAYTMGNSTRDRIIPELLCFFPGAKTCGTVLNSVSTCLIDGKITAPRSGEIREIYGVLGNRGQIPIRLRLVEEDTLDYSYEHWTTGIPKSDKYPLILVDIPDVGGYFACEDECDDQIKAVFPQELLSDEVTSVVRLETNANELPLTPDGPSRCIEYLRELMDSDEKERLTRGTWMVLAVMEDWMNPESWDESDEEIIKDNFSLLKDCSYLKGLREWVAERLDQGNSSSDINEEWLIAPVDDYIFESQDELLNQVQWELICILVNDTLEAVTSKTKLDEMLQRADAFKAIREDND